MAVVDIDSAALCKMCGLKEEEVIDGLTSIGMPVEFGELKTLLVEVTPNRPDLFSIWGIARALKAYYKKEIPAYAAEKSDYVLAVSSKTADARPAISAAVVKGLKIDEETILGLMQLQEKLHDTIGRKRKKVAIGIHDLKPIVWPLQYTVAAGEKFVPLDSGGPLDVWEILKNHPKGVAFAHLVGKKAVVIKDKEGVISFPPIINSERTRVTESTKDVLLDVTGTSQETVDFVLNIVATALADLGGVVYKVKVGDGGCPDFSDRPVKMNFSEVNSVIGIELSKKEVEGSLLRMGIKCSGENALVPPYRADIISFTDVLEDVAIGYGYENIQPTLPSLNTIGKGREDWAVVRETLQGMGFMEVTTHVLTNSALLSAVGRERGALEIKNSASEEFSLLRTSLLQSMLGCFSNNKMKGLPQMFYEIGTVYEKNEEERACFGVVGEGASLTTLQPFLQTLMKECGVGFELKEKEDPCFIKGRCAVVLVGGKEVGVVGSVRPEVVVGFGLTTPVALCELRVGSFLK